MYAILWRALPGPWPVKALLAGTLLFLVVVVCFVWLFPAVAPTLPFNDNTVVPGSSPSAPAASSRATTLTP